MRKNFLRMLMVFLAYSATGLLLPCSGDAAAPLIRADAGERERGLFQMEFKLGDDSGEDAVHTPAAARETKFYGLLNRGTVEAHALDSRSFSSSWLNRSREERLLFNNVPRFSAPSLGWRWPGLDFTLKPGVAFRTGNEETGLAEERNVYSLFFIGSKEAGPWAFRLSAGYALNENNVDERRGLWSISLSGGLELTRRLRLVGNLGMERTQDKDSVVNPAFLMGGAVYSLRPWLDLDLGIKAGLNDAEADWAMISGITIRF